jgi:poly-beta-1,6-N-acetyl-D-glucosamine synthase
MEAEPRLGTCSGKAYFPGPTNVARSWDGELLSEHCGDEMSVGMTKFYRRECFEQIGGFVREVMWDGIDCHRCRMLGWIACSWDEPDLRFIHLRPMGSSQHGIVTGRRRHGFGQYFMGTSWLYMTASALYRATKSPFLVGGAAMWWGYAESALAHKERFGDPAFRRFLRRYQLECLILGKTRATRRLNDRQRGAWSP